MKKFIFFITLVSTFSLHAQDCSKMIVTSKPIPANCFGGDGKILLTKVDGGTRPYIFEWSNGYNAQNLQAKVGKHTVKVTDAKGCVKTLTDSIPQPPQLKLTTTFTPITRSGDKSTMSNTTVGGVAPYKYVYLDRNNKPFIPKNMKVSPGAYRVRVTDSKGCTMETVGFHYITDTIPEKKEEKSKLGQNYPNPLRTFTVIEYKVPKNSNSHLELIYSNYSSYHQVYELDSDDDKIEINRMYLPDGVYIYRLVVDGKMVDSKKMMIKD